jgi:abhydrolase domain-containing protein 6
MKKALIGLLIAFAVIFSGGAFLYFFFPGVCMSAIAQVARCSAGVSRHEIQVDDHRWVYLEGGKGDVMLFVHGYGANKDFWGDMVKAFSGNYHVIVPDLPGWGENSKIPTDNYGVAEQAKRLDHFVKALGIKSFHLNGHSMGGAIAAWYAGEHSDKVKSLLLMDPFGARNITQAEWELEYAKDKTEALYVKTEKGFRHVYYLAFDRPPQLPGRFVDYLVEYCIDNYDIQRKIFEDLGRGGLGILENRLGKITAPTLIIWGKNDKIFLSSSALVFKRGIRKSRLEIIDGGHTIFIDAPEKTISLYRDFLKTVK